MSLSAECRRMDGVIQTWTEMSQSMWDDLGLRPVARIRSSHGELVSKHERFAAGHEKKTSTA